jgi:hypothetical protein
MSLQSNVIEVSGAQSLVDSLQNNIVSSPLIKYTLSPFSSYHVDADKIRR